LRREDSFKAIRKFSLCPVALLLLRTLRTGTACAVRRLPPSPFFNLKKKDASKNVKK
jgi:hypothetical protein